MKKVGFFLKWQKRLDFIFPKRLNCLALEFINEYHAS
jgi:hypothetical protein